MGNGVGTGDGLGGAGTLQTSGIAIAWPPPFVLTGNNVVPPASSVVAIYYDLPPRVKRWHSDNVPKAKTRARDNDETRGDDPSLDALLVHIGSRIRDLREMQDLSMPVLEEFTGIGVSELGRIENGERNLTVKTAHRIARAIGTHTHELFVPRERSTIRAKRRGRRPIADEPQTLEALLVHIGSRIRELREMQNLSMPALEEFTGIGVSELGRIENGERNLTVRTAHRIARTIGVHTYELLIPRERSAIRPKQHRKKTDA